MRDAVALQMMNVHSEREESVTLKVCKIALTPFKPKLRKKKNPITVTTTTMMMKKKKKTMKTQVPNLTIILKVPTILKITYILMYQQILVIYLAISIVINHKK